MIYSQFDSALLKKSFDLCVVGAGPAGISLAIKAARVNSQAQILIVDAGGARAQGLDIFKQGTQTGDIELIQKNYVNETSRYGFGGNTNFWSGNIHPIPHLMKKPNHRYQNGWLEKPISKSEYMEACEFFGTKWTAEWDFLLSDIASDMEQTYETPYIDVRGISWRERHTEIFSHSPNLHVCLNLTVNSYLDERQRIQEAYGNWNGSTVSIKAKSYVLACGGLNNLRCLAMVKSSQPSGQVMLNAGDAFLEHPTLAALHFWPDVRMLKKHFAGRANKSGYFFQVDGRDIYIKLRSEFSRHVPNLDSAVNSRPLSWLRDMSRSMAKVRKDGVVWIRLEDLIQSQQRNTLRIRKTQNSLPQLDLHYDLDPSMMKVFSQVLMKSSLTLRQNRIAFCALNTKFNENPKKLIYMSAHPSGTTPFGKSPKDSVVNFDLQHHHIQNLYIVGSSLFSKVSSFNPTLSVVALAMRLGKTLVSKDARE